ncbi:hypothetical protein B0J15DRAFT_490593 [Fusarium solani]|uniref:Secreted protein n=1 Tax=Fusarium solani TaxID=169388 RepID=A0A9P9HVE3_FUSSL|nr:uncharacterized protein B0J15DRAFT_490593 [Fusarium solani]KAH7264335.1 hypothetical protein B0J15DRAFT_490593 [Fusarium solani]
MGRIMTVILFSIDNCASFLILHAQSFAIPWFCAANLTASSCELSQVHDGHSTVLKQVPVQHNHDIQGINLTA